MFLQNARASESIEFFRVENGAMKYFDGKDPNSVTAPKPAPAASSKPSGQEFTKQSSAVTESKSSRSVIPLPVAQEEVSFNLSMTEEEQAAKRKVELPYMHQGNMQIGHERDSMPPAVGDSPFFIDEDDPDWDDDDLDDDLDI